MGRSICGDRWWLSEKLVGFQSVSWALPGAAGAARRAGGQNKVGRFVSSHSMHYNYIAYRMYLGFWGSWCCKKSRGVKQGGSFCSLALNACITTISLIACIQLNCLSHALQLYRLSHVLQLYRLPHAYNYIAYHMYLGLARTMYVRCIYGIFGREITIYTVINGVNIRFCNPICITTIFQCLL